MRIRICVPQLGSGRYDSKVGGLGVLKYIGPVAQFAAQPRFGGEMVPERPLSIDACAVA